MREDSSTDGVNRTLPVILARADYARWLGDGPDPRDPMRPFPSDNVLALGCYVRLPRASGRSIDGDDVDLVLQ